MEKRSDLDKDKEKRPKIGEYYKHKDPAICNNLWKAIAFSTQGKAVVMEYEIEDHVSIIQQFLISGFFNLYKEVE